MVGFLFYLIFIDMKKIVRLTESDLIRIIEKVIQEGKTDKGVKEKDYDVKIERFQETIHNFLKSNDCKVKQVGDDFETPALHPTPPWSTSSKIHQSFPSAWSFAPPSISRTSAKPAAVSPTALLELVPAS